MKKQASRKDEQLIRAVEQAPHPKKPETVTITPPNFRTITLALVGTSPLLQLRFSAKAEMLAAQQEGGSTKSKKKRSPKDVEDLFRRAQHVSEDGWIGIPCAAFRNAMISACRLVNYKMTLAKMAVFVEADGHEEDGTPLVRLTKGTPILHSGHARNANGSIDIRVRAMFKQWECRPRVRFDADLFQVADIVNLCYRAGQQVGVGEGRPDSRMSAGMGFGLFKVNVSAELVK